MEHFGLYLVITNPVTSYETCAEAAVKAGLRYVQLRIKNGEREEVLEHGRNFASIVKGSSTCFILNDDPELAVEAGAGGVHIGQDDGDLTVIKKRYPSLGCFGLSTHNLEQVRRSAEHLPDYIGVGPVFVTPTKAIPDPVLGFDLMAQMLQAAPCPALAIGGINTANLREVLQAGAANFAVVRDVCHAASPFDAIRRLQDIWGEYYG